jgi:hypothetical protein
MNPYETPEVQETEVKIETKPQETRTFPGHESRKVRELMKSLSMEIFGKSSRYQKLFEYDEVKTVEVDEVVPGQNGEPDTTKKVRVPLMTGHGKGYKQTVRRYRSVEEVLQLLLDFKAARDEHIAKMKSSREAARAKQEEEARLKKVQEDLGGSALT